MGTNFLQNVGINYYYLKDEKEWEANLMVRILENKTLRPFDIHMPICWFQKTCQDLHTPK